jgi:hypothetical protein
MTCPDKSQQSASAMKIRSTEGPGINHDYEKIYVRAMDWGETP